MCKQCYFNIKNKYEKMAAADDGDRDNTTIGNTIIREYRFVYVNDDKLGNSGGRQSFLFGTYFLAWM